MSIEYIEDESNIIYQVYSEFLEFLNAVYYFHTNEKQWIQHLALDSMRLHLRVIYDFFKSKGNSSKSKSDDLFYSDLIDCPIALTPMEHSVREFINKGVAHMTNVRGNELVFDNGAFFTAIKNAIISIRDFNENIDLHISATYKADYLKEKNKDDSCNIIKLVDERLIEVAEILVHDSK